MHIKAGSGVNSQSNVWRAPEDGSGALRSHACAIYLKMRTSKGFRVEDVLRVGCYMREKGR